MGNVQHHNNCSCKFEGEGKLPKTHKWYVNAPNYFNCFWNYLKSNERSHTLNEIATLLNLSISAITSIEKKAVNKMKKKINILQNNKKL